MRTFQVLVRRRRAEAPAVHVVTARDEARARALAQKLLASAPTGSWAEVFEDEALLFTLGEPG
jgi:hypothetical protein